MTLTTKYSSASKWANKIIDLFFPTVCAGCGSLGPMICAECRSKFQWVNEPVCGRCGQLLIHKANACGKCSSQKFNLNQLRSPLNYREPVSTIIHQLKYNGLHSLSKPLGQFLVKSWPDWEYFPDLIIPVPLHSKRQKRRGFNQSALLAKYLGDKLEINVTLDSLQRVKNTRPQVGLNPDERAKNVMNAFHSDGEKIKNKHILLIDDVFTTGATMFAASQSLRAAGAGSVSAYCLARTV